MVLRQFNKDEFPTVTLQDYTGRVNGKTGLCAIGTDDLDADEATVIVNFLTHIMESAVNDISDDVLWIKCNESGSVESLYGPSIKAKSDQSGLVLCLGRSQFAVEPLGVNVDDDVIPYLKCGTLKGQITESQDIQEFEDSDGVKHTYIPLYVDLGVKGDPDKYRIKLALDTKAGGGLGEIQQAIESNAVDQLCSYFKVAASGGDYEGSSAISAYELEDGSYQVLAVREIERKDGTGKLFILQLAQDELELWASGDVRELLECGWMHPGAEMTDNGWRMPESILLHLEIFDRKEVERNGEMRTYVSTRFIDSNSQVYKAGYEGQELGEGRFPVRGVSARQIEFTKDGKQQRFTSWQVLLADGRKVKARGNVKSLLKDDKPWKAPGAKWYAILQGGERIETESYIQPKTSIDVGTSELALVIESGWLAEKPLYLQICDIKERSNGWSMGFDFRMGEVPTLQPARKPLTKSLMSGKDAPQQAKVVLEVAAESGKKVLSEERGLVSAGAAVPAVMGLPELDNVPF